MPPRVLIASDVQADGGCLRAIRDLALALPRDRSVATVALPNRPGVEQVVRTLEADGIAVERLEHVGSSAPGAVTEFRSVLKASGAQLVHLHLPYPGAARWQLAAAHQAGVPIVATEHDPFPLSFLKRQVKKLTLGWTTHTIAISDWAREFMIQEYHLPLDRITRVSNGIDAVPWVQPAPGGDDLAALRAAHHPLLFTNAALEPRKGLGVLIEAMRTVQQALPQALLVVVGVGSLADELREQAIAAGVSEHVQFLGWRDDAPAIVAACDVAVQPSLREAFGLAVLEAMAAGKPVVASEVGGHLDTVERDRTGVLVPAGDAPALAQAIVSLAGDPTRRAEMGAAGRARALEQFTVGRMAARTADIYDAVVVRSSQIAVRDS